MFTSKYFNMGKVVVSRGVNVALSEDNRFSLEVGLALERYSVKDWGDLSDSDKEVNEVALQYSDDLYLLAAYQTCRGKIYIITSRISENPGENSTIVCFPEER